MTTPPPILKFPAWSVLVKIVSPPFLSAISFSGIATPPLAGIDLIRSTPEPIYSNE